MTTITVLALVQVLVLMSILKHATRRNVIVYSDAFLSPKQQPQQCHTTQITRASVALSSTATTTAAAAATRRRNKPKSTAIQNFSLVVHGPQGFNLANFHRDNATSKHQHQRPFNLVIVESPSKCATISKILQQYVQENELEYDYVITSSMGHVRNIPRTKTYKDQKIAGIDLENNYQPSYEVIDGKERLVHDLQELSAAARQLVLATDDDREGEAMAWHLLQLLKKKNNDNDNNNNNSTNDNDNTSKDNNTEKIRDGETPAAFLRVRFTEITRKAIVDAIEHPETTLRHNVVQAQETRRVLDRLAGFTVSPVLWKKIAPGLSAGRVQSVGMAITVQRERERLTFQETEYWRVKGNFSTVCSGSNSEEIEDRLLDAQLISINGNTLASGTADFNPKQANELASTAQNKIHAQKKTAEELIDAIQQSRDGWRWTVQQVTSSQRKQNPPKPFITSTFQQEANRRLGLSVSGSMRVAQQLYEKGFISYMRTDSTHLSQDATKAIEMDIINVFPTVKIHDGGGKSSKIKQKVKPQAAHEAIRPAIQENDRFTRPTDLPPEFDRASTEVYNLIYQRTIASHMPPQISNQTSIVILGESNGEDAAKVIFRKSGSVVVVPGYTIVYPRQVDARSPILPNLDEGQTLVCDFVQGSSHVTQAPARYTEASFVQELERLGVGRPSTYAGTVQILRNRAYVGSPVTSDSNRRGGTKEVSGPAISARRAAGGEDFTGYKNARGPLVPSLTAFVVTSLLEKHCKMYVDPTFTAKMEERLDKIANSENEISQNERVEYLNEFYKGEEGLAAKIENIDVNVVADIARRAVLPSLASNNSTNNSDDIGLFIGPWGPYVKNVSLSENSKEEGKSVSASLPPGMASDVATITQDSLNAVFRTKKTDGVIIGQHPDDDRSIRLKIGPYGAFLQWGDDSEDGTSTHTLPRVFRSLKMSDDVHLDDSQNSDDDNDDNDDNSLADMIGLSLQKAIQYVSLPKNVCLMDDLPIIASLGPYGPYLKYNNTFLSLKPKDGDVLTIDTDKAKQLVIDGIINNKSKFGTGVLAEIGEKNGYLITVKQGRFGEYVNWKTVNAKLPFDYVEDPSTLPLEEAWSLIEAKAATQAGKNTRRKKIADIDLPPPPKRPMSSYFLFCADKRPEIAGKCSSLGDTSKELSRLWKELADADKKSYIEMAATVKSAYEAEKRKWEKEVQQVGKMSKGGRKATNNTKISSKPIVKRPRSAYIYFCSINRSEVSNKFNTLGEISKELGKRWRNLDADAKVKYEIMSNEDQLRYSREKDISGTSSSDSLNQERQLSLLTKSKKKMPQPSSKSRQTGKKKRSPSAYMLFCKHHRSMVVDENGNKLNLPETTKVLATMWKGCDEETRKKFVDRAEIQKQEFHEEVNSI